MTATLTVLLIITLLAIFFLPFSRALMKDRTELQANPMDQKFHILIARINTLLMEGHGEITGFDDNPRLLNLFSPNQANMLIQFYYSTGTLTITLKYKYFHVELTHRMQFHDLRQAESFRQQDVANHFCEEAAIAISRHQQKVGSQQGFRDSNEEFIFSSTPGQPAADATDTDNPIDLIRGMYDGFSREQKLALIHVARMIHMADGSTEESFRRHPHFSDLLLSLQVNYSEARTMAATRDESAILSLLHKSATPGDHLIMKIMPLFPFIAGTPAPSSQSSPFRTSPSPEELRISRFYSIFHHLGYPRPQVDSEIEKMTLLMQHFS